MRFVMLRLDIILLVDYAPPPLHTNKKYILLADYAPPTIRISWISSIFEHFGEIFSDVKKYLSNHEKLLFIGSNKSQIV